MRRLSIVVLALCLAGPALAYRPQFCVRIYDADRSELRGGGWRALGIFIARGDRGAGIVQRMTPASWTSCECPVDAGTCSCCDFDVAKVCADVAHTNATKLNRLHLEICSEDRGGATRQP